MAEISKLRAAVDQVIPIQYEILDNYWYEKVNPQREEFLKNCNRVGSP